MFKKRKKAEDQPSPPPPVDPILNDFPRGVEDRPPNEEWLPVNFFEKPDAIAQNVFRDNTRDIFLGIINGTTQKVIRDDDRIEYVTQGGTLTGVNDDRHLITIAGSRSGKGRSAIIPNLLSYGGSVVVIDAKGENANRTAQFRAETLNQNVYVLDPFCITNETTKKYRKAYNPLNSINFDNPLVIEDAGLVASSLIVPGDTKDQHWDSTAKAFLEGLILHVCTFQGIHNEDRNLLKVYDLLMSKSQPLKKTICSMLSNTFLEGRVAAVAQSYLDKPENERGSVISTAQRNLKFLDYDSIRGTLEGHEFDLSELEDRKSKDKKVTIYLCLPALRMGICKQWLRLVINQLLGTVERFIKPPEIPILAILDEFPILGYMKELEDAAGQIAGLGLKLWPIIQDLTQLKAIYKDRWETFLGNTGVIQAFGNVDDFTLQHLSRKLDKTTMTVVDRSSQTREQVHMKGASGLNEKQQVQDLLTPSEISSYFARDDRFCRQLILIPGRRPYVLSRALYDQHEFFKDRYIRNPENREDKEKI